ncbi:hypothetical protein [Frankia sp. QA3]|uniref:hypothetical protein n=1 Tax=Frankia sp. QA3 TaxID=710111 RepID=UPI000269BD61|nr:hypothetical protein [Frankia sp. QA3]EIV92295.1 hypothetical protein FraQA3DRAFT_1830 [Frankia sp. QA3]
MRRRPEGDDALIAAYEDRSGGVFTHLERIVITVALDARRLGHAGALPAALLSDAAAGMLPDLPLGDDPQWIDAVLHQLCHEPRTHLPDGPGALVEDPAADGLPVTGYHPAAVLVGHAARTRCYVVPAQPFWDAAARHARSLDDLRRCQGVGRAPRAAASPTDTAATTAPRWSVR